MRPTIILHRVAWRVVLAGALACALTLVGRAQQAEPQEKGRPRLALRANPVHGFAPQRVVFTAELTGGANDYRDYYCPSIEWSWADDTRSSNTYDCDPYESGKSEIRRRFSQDHLYREPGVFEAVFRLKQGSKVVASARISIQIRGLTLDDSELQNAPAPDLKGVDRRRTLQAGDHVHPFRIQRVGDVGVGGLGRALWMRVIHADDLDPRRPAA